MGHNRKQPLIFKIYKIIICIIVFLLIVNYINSNTSLFYLRRIIMPFSFQLNQNKLYLIEGEESRLYAFNNTNRVEFKSTNFNVAGVNFVGKIKAYKHGKTYIIAKSGNKQYRCLVHVMALNKKKVSITAGKSYRLKVKGINTFVKWSSSNEHIASVNMFGKVTAHEKGTAIITAEVKGRVLRAEVIVK